MPLGNTAATCVIIKPDGVGKRVVGKIIDRFEDEGFQLMAMKMIRPNRELVESFYAEHKGKAFFSALMRFATSGPIVVMAWLGTGVVERVREMVGATNSQEADHGTLRRSYGTDNRRNLVHASDSAASAAREVAFFFSEEELTPYDPDNWITVEKESPDEKNGP